MWFRPVYAARHVVTAIGCLALAVGLSVPGHARTPLVTEAEAQLPPPAANELSRRAVTRGPTIRALSPDTDVTPVRANEPFRLAMEFVARGGARIDPASIRVTYLRASPVNITSRLQSFSTANGIQVQDAVLPAGEHTLRVDVSDDQGRTSTTLLSIRAR